MKQLFTFLCISCSLVADQPEKTSSSAEKITVEQIIILTVVQQKAELASKPHHIFGKKLNAQLNAADNETFKESFSKLPVRAKLMYMLTINTEEYQAFLERYTDEEWENMWLNASLEEQKHLPRTRIEQLTLIRDAYYAFLEQESSFIFPYRNAKAPYPSDINLYKKKFYVDDNLILAPNDMHLFIDKAKAAYLKAFMHREKIRTFQPLIAENNNEDEIDQYMHYDDHESYACKRAHYCT